MQLCCIGQIALQKYGAPSGMFPGQALPWAVGMESQTGVVLASCSSEPDSVGPSPHSLGLPTAAAAALPGPLLGTERSLGAGMQAVGPKVRYAFLKNSLG